MDELPLSKIVIAVGIIIVLALAIPSYQFAVKAQKDCKAETTVKMKEMAAETESGTSGAWTTDSSLTGRTSIDYFSECMNKKNIPEIFTKMFFQ